MMSFFLTASPDGEMVCIAWLICHNITFRFVPRVALCKWRHRVLVLQDEDSEFTLATDFEIGHFFRERIVPRAVLYFTGEALEDDESVSAFPLKYTHAHDCPTQTEMNVMYVKLHKIC